MAGHPLRPANHLSLGEPLPHQLANGAQAAQRVIACKQRPSFTAEAEAPAVVSGISQPFGWLSRTRRYVTYVVLTRAPVYSGAEAPFLPRLACVRHAASVRSEPGSNSPINLCFGDCSPRRSFLECRESHLGSRKNSDRLRNDLWLGCMKLIYLRS